MLTATGGEKGRADVISRINSRRKKKRAAIRFEAFKKEEKKKGLLAYVERAEGIGGKNLAIVEPLLCLLRLGEGEKKNLPRISSARGKGGKLVIVELFLYY